MKRRRRVKTGVVESFFASVKDSVALSPHTQAVIGQAPHPNKSQQQLEPTTFVAAKDKIQPLPLPSAAFDLAIDKTIIGPALFTFLFKKTKKQTKTTFNHEETKMGTLIFRCTLVSIFHEPREAKDWWGLVLTVGCICVVVLFFYCCVFL